MVYIEYIFSIFNRTVVSDVWDVTQTNFDEMFCCVRFIVISIIVPRIINDIHVEYESICIMLYGLSTV